MHTTAWKTAWKAAGLPADGNLRGVHNLRHTFAHRLRALGINRETRKALMNHHDGDIAEIYAPAQLAELVAAVETLADHGHTTTLLRVVA
jgi:integrase